MLPVCGAALFSIMYSSEGSHNALKQKDSRAAATVKCGDNMFPYIQKSETQT